MGSERAYSTRLVATDRCYQTRSELDLDMTLILTVLSVLLATVETKPVRIGVRYCSISNNRTALGNSELLSLQLTESLSL